MPSLVAGAQPLLGPVVGLCAWTLVMEAWMVYAYRIPAMQKYNVNLHPEMTKQDLNSKIPRPYQWAADNFNHLMEQPTQFFATVLALNSLGVTDVLTVRLAWTYVGLRIVHSVVQSVANPVPLRFGLFAGSSLVLVGLTVKAALVIWG